MSIMIHIYYTGINDNARKFVEEMEQSGTAEFIRQEDGNERYEYFFSDKDPQTVLLVDSWKNQAAIDLHHASNMMNTITYLREKYDLHMQVERFYSDTNGIPEEDNAFIRK